MRPVGASSPINPACEGQAARAGAWTVTFTPLD
jgi:hypothetical protein